MEAFMKKIRHKHELPFNNKCDAEALSEGCEADDSELALEDDQDDPFRAPGFAGKLTFVGSDGSAAKDLADADGDMLRYCVPYEGSAKDNCRVTFEVTSAEVIKEVRSSPVLPRTSSHVDYTITVTSNCGLEDLPCSVVRRYSDFELLHKQLKKRFPKLLSPIVFPQKLFVRNFTNETIARRSRAFEQYLSHLYSILEAKYSSEFGKFFTGEDYEEAVQCFMEGKHFQAIAFLERFVPVMEKLYGSSHRRLARAVCALIVCHKKLNRLDVADTYATLALDGLPQSSLTVPLMQTLARIRWSLGRDKEDVERKLRVLNLEEGSSGAEVNNSGGGGKKDLEAALFEIWQRETP